MYKLGQRNMMNKLADCNDLPLPFCGGNRRRWTQCKESVCCAELVIRDRATVSVRCRCVEDCLQRWPKVKRTCCFRKSIAHARLCFIYLVFNNESLSAMMVASPPYSLTSPLNLACRQCIANYAHRKAHVAPQDGKPRSSKLLLRLSV